jgi:hypothetical protein
MPFAPFRPSLAALRAGLAIVTIATALACGRARAGGKLAHPCKDAIAVDTTAWIRRSGGAGQLSFLVPPTFQRDSAAPSAAGGIRWRDGDRTFDAVVSEWDSSAFKPNRYFRPRQFASCPGTLAGHRALLTSSFDGKAYEITAWFLPDSGSTAPTLAITGRAPKRTDQDLFLRIARSAR